MRFRRKPVLRGVAETPRGRGESKRLITSGRVFRLSVVVGRIRHGGRLHLQIGSRSNVVGNDGATRGRLCYVVENTTIKDGNEKFVLRSGSYIKGIRSSVV